MITEVHVAGFALDPGHVLADATVLHGRGGFGEAGRPMSATVTIEHPPGSMPGWRGGDFLALYGPHGDVFAGRIADRSLSHEDRPDGTTVGRFTVTAAGTLAQLARKVGDVPWPQESGSQRAARILAAAAVPWYVQGGDDLNVVPRDVDAQPAIGLLDELAADTGAAVFDVPHGDVVYQPMSARARRVFPFRWQDFDEGFTWDDFDPALTWDGDPPSLGQWPSPASQFPLALPADAVLWEPEWSSSEATVINRVRVGWGPDDEQPTVELRDDPSIEQHGERYLYMGTQLATDVDALARASHVLTTQKTDRWQISDVVVALGDLDPDTHTKALQLVCGDHVTLQGVPQPAPAIDWTGIVEGWTYTQVGRGGVITEQLVLTLSDPLLSLAVMRWDDYPATYTWDDHPAHLTWDDLDTVAILEAAA